MGFFCLVIEAGQLHYVTDTCQSFQRNGNDDVNVCGAKLEGATLKLIMFLKRSRDCLLYTKMETNCSYSLLIHDCTSFTSRENEGIQITLYFIMSSISLVRHCCFY